MPELPEVESVRRSLAPIVVGRRITGAFASGLRLRAPVDGQGLAQALTGRRVVALGRRGKFLWLEAGRWTLLVHLGMSGRLVVEPAASARPPHTHVALGLGARELRFVDPRRFGLVRLLEAGALEAALGQVGVDALDPAFTIEALRRSLAGCRQAIKPRLLDQRGFSGLGNIYACEALFVAGISPRRRAGQLGPRHLERLHEAIRRVLEESVARGGTSLRDYVDGQGRAGENQRHLRVYGRAGEPCLACGGSVRVVVQGGRSTYYCPGCQR